jgi:hypothetical protein
MYAAGMVVGIIEKTRLTNWAWCCGALKPALRPAVIAKPPPIPRNPDEKPAMTPTASNAGQ